MFGYRIYISFFSLFLLFSCQTKKSEVMDTAKFKIKVDDFGILPEGDTAKIYEIISPSGIVMKVTNYGCIMTELWVPDKEGNLADVVSGFDNLESYLKDSPYFGSAIGRYANRIGKGQFSLEGKSYQLATNNGPNHLHGGTKGFDKVIWNAEVIERDQEAGLEFQYTSPDGEEGYPGSLQVKITYLLNDKNELIFDYTAITDTTTIVNLSQHNYYNLAGDGSLSILDHVLKINAKQITPVDETLIPTGEFAEVVNTPFDFTSGKTIGQDIEADHEQLNFGLGYDHNFVLDRKNQTGLVQAAEVYHPVSGRVMEIWTTEPGIQFYSGNFLDGTLTGKSGKPYLHRSALCLETQHFPDSPNQETFPSVVLEKGKVYKSRTLHRFYTR